MNGFLCCSAPLNDNVRAKSNNNNNYSYNPPVSDLVTEVMTSNAASSSSNSSSLSASNNSPISEASFRPNEYDSWVIAPEPVLPFGSYSGSPDFSSPGSSIRWNPPFRANRNWPSPPPATFRPIRPTPVDLSGRGGYLCPNCRSEWNFDCRDGFCAAVWRNGCASGAAAAAAANARPIHIWRVPKWACFLHDWLGKRLAHWISLDSELQSSSLMIAQKNIENLKQRGSHFLPEIVSPNQWIA